MSLENKMFCPCFSPGGRIIVQTRHESCLSWYVLRCSQCSIRKNPYGLKYKIAFSASCLLLSCCCLSSLFSLASSSSPMAKWNPAHQQAQALSVDSHPPSSALCCVGRGDLCKQVWSSDMQWCYPATALLKVPCLDSSKSERFVLGYIQYLGKAWLILIFLYLHPFNHHSHCTKHPWVCISKHNAPHGCREDFPGGRGCFPPNYCFTSHAAQSKWKLLQPIQECYCCHLLRKARLSTFNGVTEAAAAARMSA